MNSTDRRRINSHSLSSVFRAAFFALLVAMVNTFKAIFSIAAPFGRVNEEKSQIFTTKVRIYFSSTHIKLSSRIVTEK